MAPSVNFLPISPTQRATSTTRSEPGLDRERPPQERPLRPVICWSFCFFVFSLLFETVPLPIPFELPWIAGAILVLLTLTQPSRFFKLPDPAMWCFIVFFYICVAVALLNDGGHQRVVAQKLFVLIQLLVLFWIAYQTMYHEQVARNALLALVASCVVLSLLQATGITSTNVGAEQRSARLTALDYDPNHLAGILALGVLVLIAVGQRVLPAPLTLRLLFWPLLLLIGVTLIATGSRGATIALAGGLLTILMGRAPRDRPANWVLALTAIGLLFWMASGSEVMVERVQKTIDEGNMTKRELVFPVAWEMFVEKPWFGWGAENNSFEVAARLRYLGELKKATHNLPLYVLTATGVAGAVPFGLGVALCARAAWRSRHGAHGILPLALLVSIIVADMSVDGIYWKQHWLILAYALASTHWVNTNASSQQSAPGR